MSVFDSYRFGPYHLDVRRWRLERDGEPVSLQPQVLRTLLYLVQHPQRVIPKQELIAELWPGRVVTDGVLTRCIKELRQALADEARGSRYIRTASRIGYAFIADVQAGSVARQLAPIALAVLPFRPLAAERDEALELGLADNLISQLSSLQRLVVRPLSAVRRYAGPRQDALSAGREQLAEIVIEGMLNQSADRIRISLRVQKVVDATTLLARTFDCALAELPATQDAIGQCIAAALSLELQQRESRQLAGGPPANPRAYRQFLLGRFNAGRHTPDGDRRSIALFRQAVAEDSGYALAWAALADCCISLGTLETDGGHFDTAREHASHALRIQPDLAPAMTSLGTICWLWDRDWQGAERWFSQALSVGAGNAEAQIAYSDYCAHMRRYEAAIGAAGRAVEIDPNSAWANTLLAQALHMAGLHDEAIAQARRTLEIAPDFAFAHFFVGLPSMLCRRWADGLDHIERAHRLSARGDFAGALGWAYGVAGRRSAAQEILRQLEGLQQVPPSVLSFVCLGLGDEERALELLEQAAEMRDWHVLLLYAEPAYRQLRTHPRAIRLLASLQLPQWSDGEARRSRPATGGPIVAGAAQ